MLGNRVRAQALLDEEKVDVLAATSPANVFYLTGMRSLGQWLLPGVQVYAVLWRGDLEGIDLVMPHGELDLLQEYGVLGGEVKSYGTFFYEAGHQADLQEFELTLLRHVEAGGSRPQPPAEILAGLLSAKSGGRRLVLALDESGLPAGAKDGLRSLLPEVEIREGQSILQKMRQVKEAREVELLRKAARIAEAAVHDCLSRAREGMSEKELAAEFEKALIERGAMSLLSVIAFGRRSALPNAVPGQARLQRGDIIRFDVGCRYGGYASDIARIASFGEPSPKLARYYAAVLKGQEEVFAMMKPGVKAKELFERGVSAVGKAGIPHYRRHHIGHGIGIDVYEPPLLAPAVSMELEEGMVVDVETPYYELGFGSVQVEDPVVVTRDGCEVLTALPRDLIVVGPA